MKPVITVNAYRRVDPLRYCLESIQSARSRAHFTLLVVVQGSQRDVAGVLDERIGDIDVMRRIPSTEGAGPLFNLNTARMRAWSVAFDELAAPWVLSLEDDVVLSGDALEFAGHLIARYGHLRSFRGVNLGSRTGFHPDLVSAYSRRRFGIVGQAAALPKRTWKGIQSAVSGVDLGGDGLDGFVEAYFKTGFTVFPIASRYVDRGWLDATHMPNDSSDPYYRELESSFVGTHAAQNAPLETKFGPSWRTDCIRYVKRDTPRYLLAWWIDRSARRNSRFSAVARVIWKNLPRSVRRQVLSGFLRED